MSTLVSALIVSLGAAVVIVLFVVGSALISAFVLTALWLWFVTPTFGLPVPPLPAVLGLSLLVGWFTGRIETRKGVEHDQAKVWLWFFARPLLTLGLGWVVSRWMP